MLFQRFFTVITAILLILSPPLQANNTVLTQDALIEQIQSSETPIILDVRSTKEYQKGHIQGATHIPLKQLKKQLSQLADNKQQTVVVYCYSGPRARKAIKLLQQAGFDQAIELDGNYQAWKKNSLPITIPEANVE